MTAYNLKTLVDGVQLGTSASTLYTTPTGAKCEIRRLTFTNTSSSPVTVTLYLVPSGGSAGDSSTVKKTKGLAAAGLSGDSWQAPEAVGHTLSAGATIQALASAGTSVSVRGSGLEIIG